MSFYGVVLTRVNINNITPLPIYGGLLQNKGNQTFS